jgi:hypothetical protein
MKKSGLTSSRSSMTKIWPYFAKEFDDKNLASSPRSSMKQIGLTSSRSSMTKNWPYSVKVFDDKNLTLLRQGVR